MLSVPSPAPAGNPSLSSIPGLVSPPCELFPSSFVEYWAVTAGRAVEGERRLRALRAALGSTVKSRTVTRSNRFTAELGGDRETVVLLEVTYCDYAGRAPALVPPAPKPAPACPVFRIVRGRKVAA